MGAAFFLSSSPFWPRRKSQSLALGRHGSACFPKQFAATLALLLFTQPKGVDGGGRLKTALLRCQQLLLLVNTAQLPAAPCLKQLLHLRIRQRCSSRTRLHWRLSPSCGGMKSGSGKRGTRDDQITLPRLWRNHANHSQNALMLKARFSENLTDIGFKHDWI